MIFIIRHGERADDLGSDEMKGADHDYDPHLTDLGIDQAFSTGVFLKNYLKTNKPETKKVVFITSPFLRCIQTSREMLKSLNDFDPEIYYDVNISDMLFTGWFEENPIPQLSFFNKRKEEFSFIKRNPSSGENLIEFPENIQSCKRRFELTFLKIFEFFQTKYDNKSTSFVLITHGMALMASLGTVWGHPNHKRSSYCAMNILSIDSEAELGPGSPENPIIHYSVYKSHIEPLLRENLNKFKSKL